MTLKLFNKKKEIMIIIISIAIVGLVYTATISTENNIRESIIEEKSQEQRQSTMKIVNHLESDFGMMEKNLELIAEDIKLETYLSERKESELIEHHFEKINEITPIVAVFIIDRDNKITHNINHNKISYKDADLTSREYVQNLRSTMNTEFSTGYVGLDGKYQVTIAEPILDEQEKYAGLVGIVFHTQEFFKHYRDLGNIENQSLLVLDNNHNFIAADQLNIVGKHFSESQYYQNNFSQDLFNTVFEGIPDTAAYQSDDGYKIITGESVRLNGNDEYFVFIISTLKIDKVS